MRPNGSFQRLLDQQDRCARHKGNCSNHEEKDVIWHALSTMAEKPRSVVSEKRREEPDAHHCRDRPDRRDLRDHGKPHRREVQLPYGNQHGGKEQPPEADPRLVCRAQPRLRWNDRRARQTFRGRRWQPTRRNSGQLLQKLFKNYFIFLRRTSMALSSLSS